MLIGVSTIRKSYPLILFAGVMLLAFWMPLFHREFTLLAGPDMCAQTFPWFNVAAHWLKKGVFVLWDPYIYSARQTWESSSPALFIR